MPSFTTQVPNLRDIGPITEKKVAGLDIRHLLPQ